jgi:glyoxylase-like metal-dependent hydrolase (beta-lactamase superfamily II)
MPAFPRARWVMNQDEWLFWTSGQAEKQLDRHSGEILIKIARSNLLPLEGKLELLDTQTEIVPGIVPIIVPGHTPGMMALSITSEGQQLVYLSDAIIHPVHVIKTGWFAATDVSPTQVVSSRQKLLANVAAENSLAMAFHFPFPGLGHIKKANQGWRWEENRIDG